MSSAIPEESDSGSSASGSGASWDSRARPVGTPRQRDRAGSEHPLDAVRRVLADADSEAMEADLRQRDVEVSDRVVWIRDGRIDKIETRVGRSLQGVELADDSDVLSILVDQSNFPGPDLVVDLRAGCLARGRGSHGFADGSNSSCCFNARFGVFDRPVRPMTFSPAVGAEDREEWVLSQAVTGPYNPT